MSRPEITTTFHAEAPFVVPDIVARGEYRCPDCNWWMSFPTGTCPVLSVRWTCHCGHDIELVP